MMHIKSGNGFLLLLLVVHVTSVQAGLKSEQEIRPNAIENYFEPFKEDIEPVKKEKTIKDVIRENLDWSYLTIGAGHHFNDYMASDELYYEAEINQHLNWRDYTICGEKKLTLDVPVRIHVRQFRSSSSPVRTPSFNPGVRLTFWKDYEYKRGDKFNYWSMGLHHYSNGQESVSENPDGSINAINGSFSTDYLELGYNTFKYNRILQWWRLSGKVDLDATWEVFQDEQYPTGEVKLQGKTRRFIVDLSVLPKVKKRWPTFFEFDVSYKFGRDYVVKNRVDPTKNIEASTKDNIQLRLKYVFSPPDWKSMHLFIRYDYGYDDYNINFQNEVNRIQFGLTGYSF